MTLPEFLLACYAEEEAVALAAEHATLVIEAARRSGKSTSARFWALHNPTRALADIEAKRRIVAEHTCQCPDPDCSDCGACSGEHHTDPTPAPCRTLRLLGSVFTDRPDYDPAWRV